MSGIEDTDGFHESKSARLDAVDDSSELHCRENDRGSEDVETRGFVYGNYPSYYGYRNRGKPSTGLDGRLCAILRKTCADIFCGKRIVDIGCNSGLVTLQIGVDIDPSLIRKARHNLIFRYSLLQMDQVADDGDSQEWNPCIPCCSDHFSLVSRKAFPISMPIVLGPLAVSTPLSYSKFPFNVRFKCSNWILPTTHSSSLDFVLWYFSFQYLSLSLSVTKWIHLNWGDQGIMSLFSKVFKELKAGGIFILESQSFASYSKNKSKLNQDQVKRIGEVDLYPDCFCEYLLSKIGFSTLRRIYPEEKSTNGFARPLDIYIKPFA